MMNPLSKSWIMSDERNWKALCKGNQSGSYMVIHITRTTHRK